MDYIFIEYNRIRHLGCMEINWEELKIQVDNDLEMDIQRFINSIQEENMDDEDSIEIDESEDLGEEEVDEEGYIYQ